MRPLTLLATEQDIIMTISFFFNHARLKSRFNDNIDSNVYPLLFVIPIHDFSDRSQSSKALFRQKTMIYFFLQLMGTN